MCTYYDLESHPGIPLKTGKDQQKYEWLENEEIRQQLLDFKDEQQERVRLFLPQIHCSSCIWLLENLYRLRPGIRSSRVDFLKKEITLDYEPGVISLRELANLLATLGYAPDISLNDAGKGKRKRNNPSFYLKLGVAGFAYGNIMLMSFPEYLGLDAIRDSEFVSFFGILNLLMALPVILYSATGFYRSAWFGLKEKHLNIDVPITIGIIALFGRSAWEILTETGPGYMDSLAGLVFFLLAGRWFQNKTYDSLSFDRDFSSYFPLTTTRLTDGEEESVIVTDLKPGDSIIVRNHELIPADGLLTNGTARIDYSFVTGESDPVRKESGEQLYAGGRQVGDSIELVLTREVSRSYLTQLWNDEAFEKRDQSKIRSFTDRSARYFTVFVLLVAAISGLYWWIIEDAGMAANVFTAVLIVACPCALALTIPVTLGSAMRKLGRSGLYLKNASVIERMADLSTIVWDKTGTLTSKSQQKLIEIEAADPEDQALFATLASQSAHPVSRAIARTWNKLDTAVWNFREYPGEGITGEIAGRRVCIGRPSFVKDQLLTEDDSSEEGTWMAIGNRLGGIVRLQHEVRPGLEDLTRQLGKRYQQAIISGDQPLQQASLSQMFPTGTHIRFQQSPHDKISYIRDRQADGESLMMIGDGLNDAGALQQSDVGMAVAEDVHTFTPACDIITDASSLRHLDRILAYSRTSMNWVKAGLILSLGYNLIGLSIAVQGWLTPLVAAILMPASSISVVLIGMLSTTLSGRKLPRLDHRNRLKGEESLLDFQQMGMSGVRQMSESSKF